MRASGAFETLEANEAGMLTGIVVANSTMTVTASALGVPSQTETATATDAVPFSGPLYDFFVTAETFASTQAKISYSFESTGNEIVLRFDVFEIVRDLALMPGLSLNGTSTFSGTLTAPFDEARTVRSQTFQSLLPNNQYTGWAGIDTVEYVQSPAGVIADLQTGFGINAFGGTESYVNIENLSGSGFGDILAGHSGGNVFFGGGGDDKMIGRGGVDVAEFQGPKTAFTNAKAGTTMIVTGPEGVDTLEDVERLQFSDRGIAFDLDFSEPTGLAVRIIGAAFGAQSIAPDLVGFGIDLVEGGLTAPQLSQLATDSALFLSLAGSRSNVDFVNTVYRNVVGVVPSAPERDFYVGLLEGSGGTMTQAELLLIAAAGPVNEISINLAGLQQSGVEFV